MCVCVWEGKLKNESFINGNSSINCFRMRAQANNYRNCDYYEDDSFITSNRTYNRDVAGVADSVRCRQEIFEISATD